MKIKDIPSKPRVIKPAPDGQKMQEILRNTPDIRAEKVQGLKMRIGNGRYWVDAREIASKMLSSLVASLSDVKP